MSVAVVGFLFRVVNFIIISALFVHIFKKYLYPFFKDQLKQYLAFLKNLRDKIGTAKKKQEVLDTDFVEQKDEASVLLEKVKFWQMVVVQRKEKHDYEMSMRLETIKNIRKRQEQQYVKTLMQRLLVPQAFHQANLVLTEEYRHDEKKAQQFISQIAEALKKN